MAWFDEVFKGTYDLLTFHSLTPSRNRREAEFIRSALQLMPGESVLDLACGHGRHAIPLAGRGIKVTGLDITERYLRMALGRAAGSPLRLVRGDMRSMPFGPRFDAAYCFFTSFGFFDDETNFQVLRGFARSLRPGGRFLLDLHNRELHNASEPFSNEFSEFAQEGYECALLNYAIYMPDTGRLSVTLTLYGMPGGPHKMSFSVRLYSLPEIRWQLGLAGFDVKAAFGDFDGAAYSFNSPRLVVLAEKVGE